MTKIKLYGSNACMQCKTTEKFLIQKNIAFDKIDVNKSPQAIEHLSGLGYKSIPVVEILEDNILVDSWTGFQPDKIKSLN